MSDPIRIAASALVTPTAVLTNHAVLVVDGLIEAVEPADGPVDDVVLAPGFVDLQVNGVDDVAVWSARGADWERLDQLLLDGGTTTWCPTLTTAPLDRYDDAIGRIREAAARGGHRPAIAGIHLEGPFLGGKPGAHPEDAIVAPDLPWMRAHLDGVSIVTLAPESDDAIAMISELSDAGVLVSIGHTDAGEARVVASVRAGARMATHLFNAMPTFHHRAPGTAGIVLTEDGLTASLIADLVHVHPRAIALTFRAKPIDTVILVTDAVAWRSEGNDIDGVEDAPRRPDGTLAGSTLRMDQAVANTVLRTRVDVVSAVRAASTTPADLLGLDDRGRLEVGRRADIVALDPETFRVREAWIGGHKVR